MSELADLFQDASAPRADVNRKQSKLDHKLQEWAETEPELHAAVVAQLRDPVNYSLASIEGGLARVGFECSTSTIQKWRRRHLNVTR